MVGRRCAGPTVRTETEPEKGTSVQVSGMNSQRQPQSGRLSWYQFSLRSLLIAVAVVSVVVSCFAWWHRAVTERRELDRQIMVTVRSLAKKRPPNMTRGEWGSAVAWTELLVGNSLLPFEAEADDLRRFQRELEARAEGDVDMSTILWIWDEVGRLTRAGREYQRFRPQMLEEIERVGPNDDPWGMNVP